MMRSASSYTARTIGSWSRRAESMFTYWEPCPVNRKATFGAGPRPTKTPCERSSFHMAGLLAPNAWIALPAFLTRSGASA